MTVQNSTGNNPESQNVARYRANYLSEQEERICIASWPRSRAMRTWRNSTGALPLSSNVTPTFGRPI